jgi:oxygen-independent coproporphyrinogen-3 oxidase
MLATEVSHISAYALIYEDGTPLDSWRKLGKIVPVPDDEVAARWEIAETMLSSAGLTRYEISNWGRPGTASRHNGLYWACGEYLGVGAGAHSHLATADGDAVRSWVVKGPERYVRTVTDGARPVAGSEPIDARTRAAETMILGLRRPEGVSEGAFERLVGRPIDELYAAELTRGEDTGLLERTGGRVRLTKPLLANEACVLFA